jgi:hypothetical protein
MKSSILLLLSVFQTLLVLSQNSFIYKRNIMGELEIYQGSQNGVVQNNPVGVFKRNSWGYLQLDIKGNNNFTEASDPFSNRPTIKAINPSLAPVAQILNTTNSYFDLFKINQQRGNVYDEQFKNYGAKVIKDWYESFQVISRNMKSFHQGFMEKPKSIADGWHNVYIVSKLDNFMKNILKGALSGVDSIGVSGFAFVKSNQIVSFWQQEMDFAQYSAHENNAYVGGRIQDCKAILKEGNDFKEFYFIDYLLSEKPLDEMPKMCGVSFTFPSNKQNSYILIYDMSGSLDPIGVVNPKLPYFASFPGTYRYVSTGSHGLSVTGIFELEFNKPPKTINLF